MKIIVFLTFLVVFFSSGSLYSATNFQDWFRWGNGNGAPNGYYHWDVTKDDVYRAMVSNSGSTEVYITFSKKKDPTFFEYLVEKSTWTTSFRDGYGTIKYYLNFRWDSSTSEIISMGFGYP